jgi:hypothetical protein
MSATTTATSNGSLSSALATNERRHSSFHPKTPNSPNSTPSASRKGSTSSQRKGSDTPSWFTAIQERDNSLGGGSEPRKGSVVGEIKGLFGRRKSKDATPKPKQVITSKHTGTIRNILKADPRSHPSRRNSTGNTLEKAKNEGFIRSAAYMTAKEQEERRPHSGPPVLHGAALTTIISRVEEDPEQQSVSGKLESQENIVHQPMTEIPEGGDSAENDGNRPRKKSVTDVEFKPVARARKKSVFGGWYRNESGKWTR